MIRVFFDKRRRLRVRAVRIGDTGIAIDHHPNGCTYVRATAPLGAYPDTLNERLEHWAREAPDRPFLVARGRGAEWETTSYAAMYGRVRSVAQALIDRQLSSDRPVAILSGNSINHATLALAAMYAGIPYSPISPAYSLLSRDYDGLKYIFDRFRPGLVFVEDASTFEPALAAVLTEDVELVVTSGGERPATSFSDLLDAPATSSVETARQTTGPETIAKILFTSGSTGRPKGVINTQRMLCSNQAMIQARLAFLGDAPPVLCDWLPWNHTFGGNHNFGITLFHGGTMYLDNGRPTPEAFDETIRNLHDVSPTVYFNVPRGYEMLVPRLRKSAALRERFFNRLQLLFFAAAGLTQKVWDDLQALAVETCGEEILMITGLGATETAPAAIFTGHAGAASGWIGLPLPGIDVKLAPVGEKLEARVKGPCVTPGYWRDDALTRDAFDDEGFYKMGDAVRWIDPDQPDRGLMFDGRLNEDFKLSSGTWVSVGPLRAKLLLHFEGLLQDVVIVGPDREAVAGLLFLARGVDDRAATRARIHTLLTTFAEAHPAGSMHLTRALICTPPPSFEAGEVTDKGSLNQKAVMTHRRCDVDELYATPPSPRVIGLDVQS
jgi:feruloyl-CoA synthase